MANVNLHNSFPRKFTTQKVTVIFQSTQIQVTMETEWCLAALDSVFRAEC